MTTPDRIAEARATKQWTAEARAHAITEARALLDYCETHADRTLLDQNGDRIIGDLLSILDAIAPLAEAQERVRETHAEYDRLSKTPLRSLNHRESNLLIAAREVAQAKRSCAEFAAVALMRGEDAS